MFKIEKIEDLTTENRKEYTALIDELMRFKVFSDMVEGDVTRVIKEVETDTNYKGEITFNYFRWNCKTISESVEGILFGLKMLRDWLTIFHGCYQRLSLIFLINKMNSLGNQISVNLFNGEEIDENTMVEIEVKSKWFYKLIEENLAIEINEEEIRSIISGMKITCEIE